MTLELLRRVPVANTAPAVGFTVEVDQYDTGGRRLYRDAVQALTNTGVNAPFELTVGDLVPGASFCVNGTQRQVRYAGAGTVSTHDVANAPACASALTLLGIADVGALRTVYEATGQLLVRWANSAGPVTVRVALLSPATADTPAFYEERQLAAGIHAAAFPAVVGQALVPLPGSRGRERRLTTYNANTGLGVGRYRVEVTEDATGYTLTEDITIDAVPPGQTGEMHLYGLASTAGSYGFTVRTAGPLRLVLCENIAQSGHDYAQIYLEPSAPGNVLLRVIVAPLSPTQVRLRAWVYQPATNDVALGDLLLDEDTTPAILRYGDVLAALEYTLPAATRVGGSLLAPVLSNGQGGVHQLAYNPAQRLALDNLILFHPARPADATGGVVVEVHRSYDDHPEQAPGPLTYELTTRAGLPVQVNTTGQFDGLQAIAYRALIYDASSPALTVDFALQAEYGLRWQLSFADLKNHAPCRLELWVRGYTGGVEPICGQDDPVVLATDGLGGGNTQADLPDAIGSTLTMRLRTAPRALQDAVLDDRACRADFYYRDALQFTGYVQPEIYEEALLAGPVDVELTASCGLGSLKDTDFAGHQGQELRGRRSRLRTVLHCLSRTGLTLPLTVATNLVAAEMLSDETPEEAIFTDRLAYAGLDDRATLNALCQSLGGTLVQRGGQWVIISALEAAADAPARHYQPAGTGKQLLAIPSPAARLLPEPRAHAAYGGPPAKVWYWLNAEQRLQRRAGWRFYTGTADASYVANALQQGTYFSNADVWDASATVLRPEAGWLAGPGGFPVSLVESGGESNELATLWPQAATYSDARYLESELAPVEAGREGLPFTLSIEAKYVARPDTTARLWVEVVADRVGQGPVSLGAVLSFASVASLTASTTTATATLPAGLLAGAGAPRVRLHAYTVTPLERRDPMAADGFLLVKAVAVQVLPQGAKWDGKTSFVATGPGGSVRPGTPLEVFHVDAPDRAGLFLGTAAAFRRTVTRQVLNPTTQWRRADDLRGAPLLATAVLDVLALRGNPSRLLTGVVRHLGTPPEALDALDIPYDIPGRRWLVGARAWHVKPNATDVTVVEIGEGEFPAPPIAFLPPNPRILDGLVGGRRRVRLTHRGIRILHP